MSEIENWAGLVASTGLDDKLQGGERGYPFAAQFLLLCGVCRGKLLGPMQGMLIRVVAATNVNKGPFAAMLKEWAMDERLVCFDSASQKCDEPAPTERLIARKIE